MENKDAIQFDIPHKVHSSYIWLGAIRTFILIFGIIIASSPSWIPGVMGIYKAPGVREKIPLNLTLIIVAVILVFLTSYAIALLYHLLSYKFITYTISKDEFTFKRGIFIKKNVHIPYARIQTVDLTSSFLQRIVGISDVTIDTAGGSSNARVKIPYVRQTSAEVLRLLVYTLKKVALNEATYEDLEKMLPSISNMLNAPSSRSKSASNMLDYLDNVMSEMGSIDGGRGITDVETGSSIGLKNSELILSAITGTHTFACLGFLVVGIYSFAILQNYIPSGSYTGSDIIIGWFSNTISNNFFVIASIILAGALTLSWISISVRDAFNYAGFECRRKGTRLEVEHGLFKHSTQSVDLDKVQEIKVRQGFLRQIIGYASISALTITSNQSGSDEEKRRTSTGVVLHPFIKLDRVENVISNILPEFEFNLKTGKRVAGVALRRSIIRDILIKNIGFWCLVPYAVFYLTYSVFLDDTLAWIVNAQLTSISLVVIPICASVMFLGLINAILWYSSSSFDCTEAFIQVRKGGLHRFFVSIPKRRVQWIYTSINPFQKRTGTATLNVRSAAGSGGTTTRLIDLTSDDADACLKWIQPKGRV